MFRFTTLTTFKLIFLIFFPFLQNCNAENILSDNPIEAGSVNWQRDLDQALLQNQKTGMPLLVLFQEIPGCSGCKNFGQEVLTHPLLVEAIETEFIPVLVYNNRPGTKDQQWLRRYKEPGWNYQVIRFLQDNGTDIIPRKDRVWTIAGVAGRMIQTLEKLHRPVPLYLKTVLYENDKANLKTAGFAMACFWTGEYKLGKIDGVIQTEAGWYDNREITLVTYHKDLISLDKLLSLASKEKCAQRVYLKPKEKYNKNRFTVKTLDLGKYKKAGRSDQKKQLERWPEIYTITTLSPMQATKINALAPNDRKAARKWLSPKQREELK